MKIFAALPSTRNKSQPKQARIASQPALEPQQ
jgi:hypothetical protein